MCESARQERITQWSSLAFPRLGDEPWQRDAVAWVATSCGFKSCSQLFAVVRSNRFAVDYLRQAPVLMACEPHRLVDEILKAGKLRDVMARLALAYPLRRLAAGAAGRSDLATIRAISKLHPSTLAQAIPADERQHLDWIKQITAWRTRMRERDRGDNHLLEWATSHAAEAIVKVSPLKDIADCAAAIGDQFKLHWTFDHAVERTEAWHTELNKKRGADRWYVRLGVRFDEPVNYGDLPLSTSIGHYTIIALRSGAELHEDGRRMRHCVASYGADVVHGKCFIFSVREDDTPRATLEIRRVGKDWEAVQLKGPCNAVPQPQVKTAVVRFVEVINGAKLAQHAMMQVQA